MEEIPDIRAHALPYLKAPVKDGRPSIKPKDDDQLVVRKLSNDLIVTYLVDRGDNFRYVQGRHLRAAGMTEDELYKCSLENLKKLIPAAPMEVLNFSSSHGVILDQNFESSLLLIDELWDGVFAELAPNGFIAAIPAREILSFCDSKSRAGIEELRGIVRRAQDGKDHDITPILFRRVGRDWVRYAD